MMNYCKKCAILTRILVKPISSVYIISNEKLKMKEPHTGIGICHCYQCRMKKKTCSTSGRKSLKRSINKFRRKQLKLDEVIKHNRFGGYWA